MISIGFSVGHEGSDHTFGGLKVEECPAADGVLEEHSERVNAALLAFLGQTEEKLLQIMLHKRVGNCLLLLSHPANWAKARSLQTDVRKVESGLNLYERAFVRSINDAATLQPVGSG